MSATPEPVEAARFAFVVIAAGEGRRLGGVAKALLPGDRRSLRGPGASDYLEQIANMDNVFTTNRDSWGSARCVVVVGPPHEDAIRRKHDVVRGHYPLLFARNDDPSRGMASSIAIGFRYLLEHPFLDSVGAAYLWPVDHPFVHPETLRLLSATIGDHDVARPRYRGRGGHPPLIARKAWPAIASCDRTDGGARAVIATLEVVDVDVDDPGVVRDVDVPADLEVRS